MLVSMLKFNFLYIFKFKPEIESLKIISNGEYYFDAEMFIKNCKDDTKDYFSAMINKKNFQGKYPIIQLNYFLCQCNYH